MRGLEQRPWLYDLCVGLGERRRHGALRAWRAWLAGGARGRTLDLGTGTGRDLPLLPDGARAFAIDPYPWNLRAAREKAPGVPLVRARAEALPFRDGAFDTVVAGLVLCSVHDPDAALAEVRRVLAPGGSLRMLEHVRSGRPFAAWLQDRAQPAWTWLSGGCRPNRDTEAAVARAGFSLDAGERRARGVFRRLLARRP